MNTIKKGDRHRCIKTVRIGTRINYSLGEEYESEYDGCITNELGERNHHWNRQKQDSLYFTYFEPINNPKHIPEGNLVIAKVRDVKTPNRGTSLSGGIDFYVPNDTNRISLAPGQAALISSGIKARIPEGYALVVMNKSGVATKKHLIVGAELVDEDYQGEMHIHVINVGLDYVTIEPGEKIVQMVLQKMNYAGISEVSEAELFLTATSRGDKGFGSTGNK